MRLTARHTLYASYLGYITQAIINNLPALLFVAFQRDFGLSLERISLLISFNFGTQILVDFLAGKYVDHIGYRPCIVSAHVFSALGLAGLCVLPRMLPAPFFGILIAMVLNAVGGGIIEVLVSPIVESLPGDEKAGAMSLLHSFYCWGHMGVVLLSTLYFALLGTARWQTLPLLWALVPAANAVLFAFVPMDVSSVQGDSMPIARLLRSRVFWLLFLLMICSGASEQGMSQWSSLFAETGLRVSKTMGDLLGPCAFAALMGLARLFYGVAGSRIDLRAALRVSSILCIASYLLAAFAPHPVLALAGCALCGLSVGLMWPGTFSLATQTYPQGGTAMFALLALAGDVGCAGGPAVVGLVSSAAGGLLEAGLLGAIVFPALLLISLRLLLTRGRRGA